jgi:very-short-patch-repair endonuclease
MELTEHIGPGWIGLWSELVHAWGRTAVERAISTGRIERVGRGRYVVATASTAHKAAAAVQGVVSMRSAAEHHGWGQKRIPVLPDVTVARTSRISPGERRFLVPHWSDLPHSDVADGVTTKRRTLVDCMRMLPLEEALPIVESALRNRDISPAALRALAESMRGRGRTRARGLAAMANRRTANAYESVLHALASTVPGLSVRPQVRLQLEDGKFVTPDLVDLKLGIVVEAESFAWHGSTAALTRDCERYNALVNLGFTVVRFSWSQVMFKPAYVLGVLASAVNRARVHANVA